MNTLPLSGYGISLSADSGCLHVKDARDYNKEPKEYTFKSKFTDINNIVIYGHSGNISLDAMKWLSKMNVQLTILNWDGRVLTNVLIPEMKQATAKMAQYKSFENGQRVAASKKIIDDKAQNTRILKAWLIEQNPEFQSEKSFQLNETARYLSRIG